MRWAFVEHHHIGGEDGVDVLRVSEHLLVIDDRKEGRLAIPGKPLRARAENQFGAAFAKARDLFFPFRFERSRTHDEDAGDALASREQFARSNCLDGLAEPHLVREQNSFAECEMKHPLALIRQQLQTQEIEARTPGFDVGEKRGTTLQTRTLTLNPIQPRAKMA
jgi:hypothetical protein